MIELHSANTYKQPSELILEFNQFSGPSSVNRSDLYAPHTSTNASRDMSYNRALYNTNESDDIYDFDSTSGDHMIPQSAIVNDPSNGYSYTDEDDDDEDDINFDYEYGYDYERVIKDRLAKVNQDFVNDSEPPKRKSILVSFDAAVTAIDIPIEEQQKQNEINFVNAEEKLRFRAAVSETDVEENNVIKLPLNDTVQKEDPDHFANQVRIRNSMYDAQVLELQQGNNNSDRPPSQSGDIKSENVNILEPSRQKNNKIDNDKASPPNPVKFTNEYMSSTPSPPPSDNPSNTPTSEQTTSNNNDTNKKLIDNYENSDWTDSSSSQTKSEGSVGQSTRKKQSAQSIEPKKITHHKNDQPHAQNHVLEPQKQKINNPSNKIISFSSTSRPNAESPSPISSLHSTPEPPPSPSHSKSTAKPTNIKQPESVNEPQEFTKDSSDKTLTDTESNSIEVKGSKDPNERILVEKDGIFKLMTTQEHTAYERQKIIEQQQKENKSLNSSISSSKSGNQTMPVIFKQASPIKILPHPPPRGNSAAKNNKNASKPRPRSSYIASESTAHTNSLRARFEQLDQSSSNQSSQRSGNSVDSKSRRSTSARTRRTPEYAQGYRSPYQQTCKVVRVVESVEERQKREREERERKQMNEMAFKAWLKIKEEQREAEMKRMKKMAANNETSGNGTINTVHSDDKVSFEAWLAKKNQQLNNEKDFKKTLDEYQIIENARKQTPDERNKAFKEWLHRKNKEKTEQAKQEKLELKKWTSKRRRSRKHQRLSQALELAQAYGYNSSFRSPGPFSF